jgi:glycosyltransferase involved in cell wall biosynthesis
MKVCYFGTYDESDPRNKVVLRGLRSNGVEVIECHSSLFKNKYQWMNPLNYLNLTWKFLKLKGKFDSVIIGFSMVGTFIDIFIAKIFSRKKIILNPLVSLYGTIITDRKIITNVILSKMIRRFEKWVYSLSDIIMVDTFQNMNYVCNNFDVDRTKCKRVLVSADTNMFYPRNSNDDDCFTALFWGGASNPLHGTEYIIDTAKLLEPYNDIKIVIAGKAGKDKTNTDNLIFTGFVEDLQKLIGESDVCLGIFGGTEKAVNVIPNKAYETLAMKKPLITGKSPAIVEIFNDKKNVVLCEMANPESIAEAILLLRNDKELRENIAEEGYKMFMENLTPKKVGEDMIKWI